MYDEADTSKSVTYVHTETDGFKKDMDKRYYGMYQDCSEDGQYFVTGNYDGYIMNMCTIDGDLVRTYENNSRYAHAWSISKSYGGTSKDTAEFLFKVYDYERESGSIYSSESYAYILSNGEIGQSYDAVRTTGNFVLGYNYDGTNYVINGDNNIVFEGQGSVKGHYDRECFSVNHNNVTILYDRDGNIIWGGDNRYIEIGNGAKYDEYMANEYDDIEYYGSPRDMAANGMCVIAIEENGVYKYGAIRVDDSIKIDDANVKLSCDRYTYDGKAKTPIVQSIVVNNKVLVEGKDYTVSYKNNVKVGQATVVITGIGNCYGVCNVSFDIVYGTGMYKGADGQWYYYTNGVVDKTYIGLAKNSYGWWYMNKGKLDTSYTGLVKYKSNWVYVNKGKMDASYTGLVKYKSNWVYVSKGKLDSTYTGLVKYKSNWVYVNKGKLDASYTGLVKYKSTWVYVCKGKLDASYTGMAKNQYGWWYVTKGKLDLTFTGIAKNPYGTWYLKNGKLDLTFSGKVTVSGKSYTIKNGKVV